MAISKKRKILVAGAVVVGLVTIVVLSKTIQTNDGQPVETARVEKRSKLESKVTASGEVRPVELDDLTAEVSGLVQQIYVHEGDTVKKGQPLVKIDPTQSAFSTEGQEAALRSAQADDANAKAAVDAADNLLLQAKSNLISAEATLAQNKALLRFDTNEYHRNEALVENGVISKSVFDNVKTTMEQQEAATNSQEARVTQLKQEVLDSGLRLDEAKAAEKSAEGRVKTADAGFKAQEDLLKRTIKYSPIDGVVSSLPVKVGTFALANFSTTPLLTVADMSAINAEIRIDETDIASVAIGQLAKVKVDALGETEINGKVVEKAASAITRSGQTISQTTGGSQEAKDFIVKVRLEPTPEIRDRLRPGMSATAVITTATVDNLITVPLAAVVPRDVSDSGEIAKGDSGGASGISHKHEVEGVFIFGKDRRAHFAKVETGIKGDQDIEVKSGINEGDEIVVGPYKTLRSLKDGDLLKRELALLPTPEKTS
ncbi:MAG TPA: efflux RND transporter periplasmic adaptor subunit [Blastocatellia bacterium]